MLRSKSKLNLHNSSLDRRIAIYLANDLGIIINSEWNPEFNDAVTVVFYIKRLELFREFITTNEKRFVARI